MTAFVFTAHWLPTAVTAMLLALLVGLGLWQLERAGQKAALVKTHAELRDAEPIDVGMVVGDAGENLYRPVLATGRYDSSHQFLLDNRTHAGKAGYHVLTPLITSQQTMAVLVNRGWVATGPYREQLPELSVSPLTRTVKGQLRAAVEDAFLLGESGYGTDTWPRVIQRIEYDSIQQELGVPLLRFVIRLDAEAPDGFERAWPVHYGIPAERHRGYAFQWFSLAVTLVVLYAVVNTRRKESRTP